MHQNSGYIKTTKSKTGQQAPKTPQDRREKAKEWVRTDKRAQTL